MKTDEQSCCGCLKSICSFYITCAKYSSLSFCCCVLGMLLMTLILLVYYGVFITITPSVATEQHVKHEHVSNSNLMYPEVNSQDDSLHEYDSSINEIYRQRRSPSSETQQLSTPILNSQSSPSSKPLSTTLSKKKEKETNISSVTDRSKSTKSRQNIPRWDTTSHTTEAPDNIPDFQLSNQLIDSVFSAAEASGMKEPLGLCRKHADVKIPEVKATLFPSDQAGEILNCINDLLRNQTKKQICLHLDPEMNAYLKWLLMTGESRERHRPVKISSKEDFLFPSTCVPTSDSDSATTQCFAEPRDRADFDHR